MRRFLRSFTLIALGLSVAACDSSESDPEPNAFLGRWNVEDITMRTLATLSEQQRVFDSSQPGQGGIQVTGDAEATLRYLGYLYSDGASESIHLTSYDYRSELTYPRFSLYLTDSGSAQFYVEEEDDTQGYYLESGAQLYTLDDDVLTVNEVTLSDGTGTVTVGGTLTFASRTIPANQEAELSVITDADLGVQVEFAANGVLRTREGSDTETGRWEVVGDQLRLDFTGEDPVLASYEINGNTLSLSYSEEGCDDADCFRYFEGMYSLKAGTLTRLRYAFDVTLTRATAPRPSDSARPGDATPRLRGFPFLRR